MAFLSQKGWIFFVALGLFSFWFFQQSESSLSQDVAPPSHSSSAEPASLESANARLPTSANNTEASTAIPTVTKTKEIPAVTDGKKDFTEPGSPTQPQQNERKLLHSLLPALREDCDNGEPRACDIVENGLESDFFHETLCIYEIDCSTYMDQLFSLPLSLEEKTLNFPAYSHACQRESHENTYTKTALILESQGLASFDDQMEYYTMACDLDSARGCVELASLYLHLGHQRLHDQYYQQACRLGAERFSKCTQYRHTSP